MVLRQGILKEEITKFIIPIICVMIPALVLGIAVVTRNDNFPLFLVFILVLYLPILIATLLLALNQLEWYYVYNDRIEARGVYGIKNMVYYKNVQFVEEKEIPLTSRGTLKTFFLFHDGRKDNGNIFGVNSCYNRKKYTLRIYATPELEAYIVNTLSLEIRRCL